MGTFSALKDAPMDGNGKDAPLDGDGVEKRRHVTWRALLYDRFHDCAHPLLIFEDGIVPAASLWAGARIWTAAFREAGLQTGDRVLVSLPPSPGFLCVLLAGLWEGLTLALSPPGSHAAEVAEILDVRASVGIRGAGVTWEADRCGLPCSTGRSVRTAQRPPTPDVRLLLSTSGTTGAPLWVALSDVNLFSVLDTHIPHLALSDARVLSALPWHHAFGLVIELLPALFSGAEVCCPREGGQNAARLVALMEEHAITHFSAVPLLIERLLQVPGGEQALRSLRGGVVGGAPVSASLAEFLEQTKLRAGYGQTEASPGIALGLPGVWGAGYLGKALGCRVRTGADGVLHFSGPNACLGLWREKGLERLIPDRWVNTGDIVRQEKEGLYFVARADEAFKLSNGKRVAAGMLENVLRTRFSAIADALLHSPDGCCLELLVSRSAEEGSIPTLREIRTCLGTLGNRLTAIEILPASHWVKTPKGDVDRNATLQTFFHS